MIIRKKHNIKGFTLTEVLVTIAVSSILFVMVGTVITSFVNSYRFSTRLRDLNNECDTLKSYLLTSSEYLNSHGYSLKIVEDENKLSLFVKEENIDIFTYFKKEKSVYMHLGNTTTSLEYIQNIEISYLDKNGIVLRIYTVDDGQFVTYYNVLNIDESGVS